MLKDSHGRAHSSGPRLYPSGSARGSTARLIRLYSICNPTKGDHPRRWASVFACAIHQAGAFGNASVQHFACANQVVQCLHGRAARRGLSE
jgi:hypothetical protein